MIQSFKHKGLKMLWEENNSSKLPPEFINRMERMLDVIDSSQQVPEDFGAY
jgi:proteic killer suppression protein